MNNKIQIVLNCNDVRANWTAGVGTTVYEAVLFKFKTTSDESVSVYVYEYTMLVNLSKGKRASVCFRIDNIFEFKEKTSSTL